MSVSLILIPTALAIAAAVGGTGLAGVSALRAQDPAEPAAAERHEVRVQTRMKDPALLGAALGDLGAIRVDVGADVIAATIDGIRLEMTRDEDGVWTAHVEAEDGRVVAEDEATALVRALDGAYARRVQQEVAERIRQRADGAGFDLVSETRDADDSVTMILNVKEHLS